MSMHEPIVGRYVRLQTRYGNLRIFYEQSGRGIPLICLHTAGADSRQFRHLLNDSEITEHFQVIAFDLPYHGRSNPPEGWWLKDYRLTADAYLNVIREFWSALGLRKPVVMGCSMGGAIVLKVAAVYEHELTGIVGLESAAFATGRDNDFLHHPAVHGGELAASYTYGLNAPMSPEESRRENWWYYSQSGPGVYKGDVHYYCVDNDTRDDLKTIDTARCKVSLLSGEYDYSATPAMTKAAADAIPGARFTLMKGIGHFPMVENYAVFRNYLLPELEHMKS